MPHIVAPIPPGTSLEQALCLIKCAHDYLVKAAVVAAKEIANLPCEGEWGMLAKRRLVILPNSHPHLMVKAENTHAFTEVMNQCATMERLLGALLWAMRDRKDFSIKVCHPTTSSRKKSAVDDNDLILTNDSGICFHFEISDVASNKDGNNKELNDLVSLGVLKLKPDKKPKTITIGDVGFNPSWISGRRFLVVSEEFGARLMKPTRNFLKSVELKYREVGIVGSTWIIEVLRESEA